MRTNPTRDEGSALILALIGMTSFAIILAAVLTLVQTSQSTTVALRGEATASYDADGAIQQAINTMQRGRSADDGFKNEDGQLCFRPDDTSAGVDTDTMVVPDPDGTGSMAVVCSGTPGSGAMSPDVPITAVNKPGNAILTLGGTEGVYLDSTYNLFNRFDIGGPVFSHGPIRTNGRSLTARQYVIAKGACSDPTKITPTAECNYTGPVSDPGRGVDGLDPNYPLPSFTPTSIPYREAPSPPSCILGTFSTVTFEPGYYDDAAALNAVTSRGCTHYFRPGIYYFDFHNGDNSALPANLPVSTAHEWRVTNGRLIAGTRTGTFSSDCKSPLKYTANGGVRFIFGGNSRLVVDGGSAAICGIYSSTEPAVAIHGVKTGAEVQSTYVQAPSADSHQLSVNLFKRSTDNQASKAWDGVKAAGDAITASWKKSGTNSENGTIEVSRTWPAGSVPAGSVVDKMFVTVRGTDATPTTTNADTRSVKLTVGSRSCTLPVVDDPNDALIKGDLDVVAGCSADLVNDLRSTIHGTGSPSSGPKLLYTVTLSGNAAKDKTELLDQLTLDVTYRAPTYRSQQGAVAGDSCVLSAAFIPSFAPGGPNGGCTALNLHTELFSIFRVNSSAINGTVYTPHASIVMTMDAVSLSALRSGVISRSLYVQTTGLVNYATVAAVPFSSQGTDPSAYLAAYSCPTTSTCSATTGIPKVRAKVTLWGQTTTSRRAADITSYSVLQ